MTKVELQEKCVELLHGVNLRLLAAVPKAVDLMDYEAEPADTYRLARTVVAAVVIVEADCMVDSMDPDPFHAFYQVRKRLWRTEKEGRKP